MALYLDCASLPRYPDEHVVPRVIINLSAHYHSHGDGSIDKRPFITQLQYHI